MGGVFSLVDSEDGGKVDLRFDDCRSDTGFDGYRGSLIPELEPFDCHCSGDVVSCSTQGFGDRSSCDLTGCSCRICIADVPTYGLLVDAGVLGAGDLDPRENFIGCCEYVRCSGRESACALLSGDVLF